MPKPQSGQQDETIVDVIIDEHERLRAMFDELEALDQDDDRRRSLWDRTRKDLLAHHEAEEEALFSALVQTTAEARHESLHAVSEHGEHKKVLEQMEALSVDDEEWDRKFGELRHDVLHHLDEEEEDVLPLVKDVMPAGRARELASKYRSARQ